MNYGSHASLGGYILWRGGHDCTRRYLSNQYSTVRYCTGTGLPVIMLNTTLGPSICSTRETLKPDSNQNSKRQEVRTTTDWLHGLQPAVQPFSSKLAKATYQLTQVEKLDNR